MKIIDVVYYSHQELASTKEVIEKQKASFGYVQYLKARADIRLIKHFKSESREEIESIPVMFFKRRNKFWNIPVKTHRYIKSAKPDVVIVEGLIFPLQVIALKLGLGKGCSIIVQHHGERPFTGLKKMLQVIADKCTAAYLFTSIGNSREWLEQKIINAENKCHEALEASSFFTRLDKEQSRRLLGINSGYIFLWVGRLNQNKDPLTVLFAFEKYIVFNKTAKLYMIYQTAELLPEINKMLQKNSLLNDAVKLIGQVSHDMMATWYSSADFYISASLREGSGYSLLEAMSCGCIPIVSSIPSFCKVTVNGNIGFLFYPADIDSLFGILKNLPLSTVDKMSAVTLRHFSEKLSFRNIADDIYNLCVKLNCK